ncbi:MAG: MFS transporter, partial [Sciscionella sp.]
DKGVIGLAAQPIMHDLGLSPSEFGLVGSSLFFLFCVTPVGIGLLANRVSTRWVLVGLVVCWSIAQVPVLLVAALPTLIGSRVLLGAAEGPTTPMVVHHIYKWFPHRERALPAGVGTAGAALGLAVAAPGLSAVIVHFGWQAAFGVLAAAGLIWAAVWVFIGRDGPFTTYRAAMSGSAEGIGDAAEAKADAGASGEEARVPYRRIMTSSTWIGATLGGHLAYWAIAIFAAWLPSYFEKGLGFSPVATGSLMLAPSLVGFAAMVGGGAVCRMLLARGVSSRWACGFVESALIIVGGIALLAVAVVHPGTTTQIALLAIGFGLPFGALPLANMSVAEVSPVSQRAAVMSFSVIGMTIAGLFAPTVAGALIGGGATALGGYHHMMLLVGALMVVGAAIAALLIRPLRDARKLGLPDAAEPTS